MVVRPIFSPLKNKVGVDVKDSAPFIWNSGFAFKQKQKNVMALHEAIKSIDPASKPLEISSKSIEELGTKLSAFNLGTWSKDGNKFFSVESVYQASKVFEGEIGPFPELYGEDSAVVRSKVRSIGKSHLVAYKYGDVKWRLHPTRAFYDWIYCRALNRNPKIVSQLEGYNCFTDIEFNPVKSLNCQAYAVSLYLSMLSNGVLDKALKSQDAFLIYHPNDVVCLLKSNSSKKGFVRKKKPASELPLFEYEKSDEMEEHEKQ